MDFIYKVVTNIEIGQTLYGIIGVSRRTYSGVYPIVVCKINANQREIIFGINQPCNYVSCKFSDMDEYVFESEEEAKNKIKEIEFGEGLYSYNW